MDLSTSKVYAIVALLIGSLICGMIPTFLTCRRNRCSMFTSYLLCFGGGVLLATAFIQILPEVREELPVKYRQYTELFFCIGFFTLQLVDVLVHVSYSPDAANQANRTVRPSQKYSEDRPSTPLLNPGRQPSYNPAFQTDGTTPMYHVNDLEPCRVSLPVTDVGLLVALSVHSVFGCLIVGLEESQSKVFLLLAAIATHKLLISFCVGVKLISNPLVTFFRHFVSILILAAAPAVGIAIGMLVEKIPKEVHVLVAPILKASAGGALFYVTASDILPRERARWRQQQFWNNSGLFQFLSYFLGFAFIVTSLELTKTKGDIFD